VSWRLLYQAENPSPPGKYSSLRISLRSSRLGGESGTALSARRREGRKEDARKTNSVAALLFRTTKPKILHFLEKIFWTGLFAHSSTLSAQISRICVDQRAIVRPDGPLMNADATDFR